MIRACGGVYEGDLTGNSCITFEKPNGISKKGVGTEQVSVSMREAKVQ